MPENTNHKPKMDVAMAALLEIFPSQPILLLVAFPSDDSSSAEIHSGSTLAPNSQIEMMEFMCDTLSPIPDGEICH